MKRPRFKHILALCGLMAVGVGLIGVWVSRQKQQYVRNRALIAAIRANDTPSALSLLEQGADPNTREEPDEPLSPWKLLWDKLRGHPTPPNESRTALLIACFPYERHPTELGLVFEKPRRDLVVIQALLARGADVHLREADGTTAMF